MNHASVSGTPTNSAAPMTSPATDAQRLRQLISEAGERDDEGAHSEKVPSMKSR